METVIKLNDLQLLLTLIYQCSVLNILGPNLNINNINVENLLINELHKNVFQVYINNDVVSFDLQIDEENCQEFTIFGQGIEVEYNEFRKIEEENFCIERISVKRKKLKSLKYIISYKGHKYYCSIIPDEKTLRISIKSYKSIHEKKSVFLGENFNVFGTINETNYNKEASQNLSVDEYLCILNEKYEDFSEDYFFTYQEPEYTALYSFQEHNAISVHLIDQKGIDYLIYVDYESFLKQERNFRVGMDVNIAGDLYKDAEIDLFLIKARDIRF